MNQIKQMHEDLLGLGLAHGTIAVYCTAAKQFLAQVEGDPDDLDHHDALRYLGGLREKTKANTRKVAYYALRAFYKSVGVDFDVQAPKDNSPGEISRPMLKKAEVNRLIAWAREGGTPRDRAFLALSTVFGLRRSELVALRDVDIEDSLIMIWTKKGGDPKRHLMPDCIAPAIYGYDQWASLCPTSVSILFKAMLIEAGLGFRRGYGWHSIRRCLVTELIRNDVDSLIANRFMRWHGGRSPLDPSGMLAMTDIYTRFEDREIDEMVFSGHPFLEAWEDKL